MSTSKQRLNFIDNLRASTMLAVLIAHILVSFTTPNFYAWPVRDIDTSKIFNALVLSLHVFTMPLFFFVAGLVAYRLHGHLGSLSFIRSRLRRIGVPLLIGTLFLFYYHLVQWIAYITKQCQLKHISNCLGGGGVVAVQVFFSKDWLANLRTFFDGIGSLWFLYYLLILYVIVISFIELRRIFSKYSVINKFFEWFSSCCQKFISTRWHVILFIIFTAFILLPLRGWYIISSTSFVPNIWLVIYFAMFFWYGWQASHTLILLKQWQTQQWLWLCILIVFPAYVLLVNYQSWFKQFPSYYFVEFGALLLGTSCSWLMVLAASSFYFRYLNHTNRVLRYLADASYWVYLIGLPMIIYWQVYLSHSRLNVLLKIMIIFSSVMFVSLLSYQILVRHTFIGRVILGKKKS